jgi:hypothetical protein
VALVLLLVITPTSVEWPVGGRLRCEATARNDGAIVPVAQPERARVGLALVHVRIGVKGRKGQD